MPQTYRPAIYLSGMKIIGQQQCIHFDISKELEICNFNSKATKIKWKELWQKSRLTDTCPQSRAQIL